MVQANVQMTVRGDSSRDEIERRVSARFTAFVADEGFPCLAGKGAVRRGEHTVRAYDALGSRAGLPSLARELGDFVRGTAADGTGLHAFVAVFPRFAPLDEVTFERRLWRQLQLLHDADTGVDGWDPNVSDDPASAAFSFSFGGRALFVVGLHPASSRLSRRFHWPALVFNPRAQFERLRAEGTFDRLRARVRERDLELQGTLNPNLADFGERSEARQYSGRAVEPEWRCPFHRNA